MKINGVDCSGSAEPKPLKTITIEFDAQEELAEFYSLFNFGPTSRALQYLDAEKIRSALGTVEYEAAFSRIEKSCEDWYTE